MWSERVKHTKELKVDVPKITKICAVLMISIFLDGKIYIALYAMG